MFYRKILSVFLTAIILSTIVSQAHALEVTTGQSGSQYNSFSTALDGLKRFVKAKIQYLQDEVNNLETRVTDVENRITNVEGRTTNLETRVTDLEAFNTELTSASDACPTGYAIRVINPDGTHTCAPTGGGGGGGGTLDNYSCPTGEVLSGVVNGAARCTPLGDGGGGDGGTLAELELSTGTLSSTGCGGRKGSGCRQGRRNIAAPGTFCMVYQEAFRSAYRYNSMACRYNQSNGQLTAGYYSSGHGDQGITTCRYYCFENTNVTIVGGSGSSGGSTGGSTGGSSGGGSSGGSDGGSDGWTDYLGLEREDFR